MKLRRITVRKTKESSLPLDTVSEITMNNRGGGERRARARRCSTSRSYFLCRKGRRSIRARARARCEDSSISFCECGTRGTSCIRDASSWLCHISRCEVCEFALSGESAIVSVRRGEVKICRAVRDAGECSLLPVAVTNDGNNCS